jgi:hypothetical protein
MAASFPNAKKTFSQIVNGVTKLVALIFNANYDETEAIETFIGPTGGGAQSYSENLTNMLYNYRRGCRVDYKGTTDFYVRSGEIMITDASGNRRLRRNTSDLTCNSSNMDVGSLAANTSYYLYGRADAAATTFTAILSTSATAPAGATFFKKIGAMRCDSSNNIGGITNLNLMGGMVGNFDSGWFAVAASTSYALVHNLGTTKVIAQVYISDNSDGSGICTLAYSQDASTTAQCTIESLSTTQASLRTYSRIFDLQNAAGRQYPTTAYARVIITALE